MNRLGVFSAECCGLRLFGGLRDFLLALCIYPTGFITLHQRTTVAPRLHGIPVIRIMLRTVCSRSAVLGVQRAASIRFASSAVKVAQEVLSSDNEGYGNDYGAGPSRVPYESRSILPPLSDVKTRIDNLPAGSFSQLRAFEGALQINVGTMSESEIRTIVLHLLERGQVPMAVQVCIRSLETGQEGAAVSEDMLIALAKSLENGTTPQGGPRLTRQVDSLMQLVHLLRSRQIRRPKELLIATMQLTLTEKRPDKAAAIFVGMVEDWVTEGRVAEGADPESFHAGGGPPVVQTKTAMRHSAWWIGVRTWKLPGEVLSPHQRQDLWHPDNLSLGEKLRGFPFASATSPPSLVPAPTSRLLDPILKALQIDPKVAKLADFEASMRALAILANAIHNRTLPCLSVGPLIDQLQRTPYSPPVYPLDMPDVPKDQRWAYEATVHIHLALQSLMFSPPISSSSFAEAHAHEAVITGTAPMGSLAHFYRMQPLGFKDCVSLVRYGFERLRVPAALRRLVNWTKTQYNLGGTQPSFWNAIFRGASEIKDNRLALTAEKALFGHTALAPASDTEVRAPTRSNETRLTIPRSTAQPTPNQHSLVILIQHLSKTSQFERLERLIYQLIPFLQAERKNELVHLSPDLYAVIMNGLRLAGRTGLAQRVYNLALQAERQWAADIEAESDGRRAVVIPASARLPIGLFTSMMSLWADEVRGSYPRKGRAAEYVVGWKLPRGVAPGVARHEAAGIMAAQTYRDAKERWTAALSEHEHRPRRYFSPSARRGRGDKSASPTETFVSPIRPDANFFTATLGAHSWAWGLRIPSRHIEESARKAFDHALQDMEIWGIAVPDLVKRTFDGEDNVPGMTQKDWKCGLLPGELMDESGKEALVSEDKTRAAAEELLHAEEEGLWRHHLADEVEGRLGKNLRDLPEAHVVRD